MKTMVITGAGSGLGSELALLFSKHGYHLILTGRTIEKLVLVKREIEAIGGSADFFQLDIRNEHEISKMFSEIDPKYSINGLVNNAGVGHFGPILSISNTQMREMFETNVFGMISMTKAVLPYLIKQGEGHILNIISTAGLRGKINESIYVASKFAARGFTESLQKEFEGTNINITGIYMGGMNTPFWENSSHVKDPSKFRSPKEIAEIIFGQLHQDTIIIESKKS